VEDDTQAILGTLGGREIVAQGAIREEELFVKRLTKGAYIQCTSDSDLSVSSICDKVGAKKRNSRSTLQLHGNTVLAILNTAQLPHPALRAILN
jgi:protein subunit release factor B